jgi:hypothetical protein
MQSRKYVSLLCSFIKEDILKSAQIKVISVKDRMKTVRNKLQVRC